MPTRLPVTEATVMVNRVSAAASLTSDSPVRIAIMRAGRLQLAPHGHRGDGVGRRDHGAEDQGGAQCQLRDEPVRSTPPRRS